MMYANAGFGFLAYSSPVFDLSSSSSSAAPVRPPPPLPVLHQHEGEADDAINGDMGQPSLISEYDLGKGDLFKAPESIIEEPLLSLNPVVAAISMMSCGENAMDDTIKVSDMGLSEVLYECEKKLMEESAIEETISKLLDVIPTLQVEKVPGELRASPSAGECSLQKSVSSGCLNSADRMNGSVRPNFLDFHGLDFEAAFGLRKAYSEGNISQEKWISEILSGFERKGYKLVAIKLVVPSKQFAEKHYHDLKERPFFSELCDFLSSGPVLAMAGLGRRGRYQLRTHRNLIEPGTIRGDLAIVVGRNIIHGSDGLETAKDKIALWFQPKELVSYTSNEEKWIYGVN